MDISFVRGNIRAAAAALAGEDELRENRENLATTLGPLLSVEQTTNGSSLQEPKELSKFQVDQTVRD